MGEREVRMTAPTVQRDDLVVEEMETDFAKVCTVSGDCENEAKWAIWAMHAGAKCPFDGYACDEHKKVAEDYWGHIAKCGKHACGRCNVKLPIGQLSKYFRAIWL